MGDKEKLMALLHQYGTDMYHNGYQNSEGNFGKSNSYASRAGEIFAEIMEMVEDHVL